MSFVNSHDMGKGHFSHSPGHLHNAVKLEFSEVLQRGAETANHTGRQRGDVLHLILLALKQVHDVLEWGAVVKLALIQALDSDAVVIPENVRCGATWCIIMLISGLYRQPTSYYILAKMHASLQNYPHKNYLLTSYYASMHILTILIPILSYYVYSYPQWN